MHAVQEIPYKLREMIPADFASLCFIAGQGADEYDWHMIERKTGRKKCSRYQHSSHAALRHDGPEATCIPSAKMTRRDVWSR